MTALDIPLFGGQGVSASSQKASRLQALQDMESGTGLTVATACLEAFHGELASLSPPERSQAGIDLADFPSPGSLLAFDGKYYNNPVISSTSLFLAQVLRYLHVIPQEKATATPFRDSLGRFPFGVLGFSSGALAACVVASSDDLGSFIGYAIEAFRLAIWIGVRAMEYRTRSLASGGQMEESDAMSASWGVVLLGISKNKAESLLRNWTQQQKETASAAMLLYITAVLDETCVTISGRPDILRAFVSTLELPIMAHETSLDMLYHSPDHQELKEQVMQDISRRAINFPTFEDLKQPIFSTANGEDLKQAARDTHASLVELIVDMILTQPVNWDQVLQSVKLRVDSATDGSNTRLANFGPGSGLLRTTERALQLASVDWSKRDDIVRGKHDPIAIVGMAVNMPNAPDKHALWQLLENGINTISEIPQHRFKVEDYDGTKIPGRQMKAHMGNFLQNVDEFDNTFFQISPREAKSMDPQQRLLLQTAYEALEDAGYVPNATPSFRPETFGCYIGAATSDYVQNLKDDIDVYYSTGTLRAFLSGRISFAMQLSGPSMVVDTACSSSNVALYLGARAIINGDCSAALVGGVNVISSPDMFIGLDRGHFLSPSGPCKAFDASADGYSRSEGCGLFVLKRLSDAENEHDQILGVIRGVEINQSGNAHSITYPHAGTQAMLFRKVLETSGMSPERVNVVEAHGTGTQAGDPNEVASLRAVLCGNEREQGNPLHITSIKANIGHLEAASGAAGLAKLLLMFQHRAIPAQISYQTRNPLIHPWDEDGTVIPTTCLEWHPAIVGLPRVAMLNNFGAAGSNTAAVLEEYCRPSKSDDSGLSFVFGLSAKTAVALEKLKLKYIDWLNSSTSNNLADISYTMTVRRQLFSHRIAVSASSHSELIQKLSAKSSLSSLPSPESAVVFVFSGQGGQYIGMGHMLYLSNSLFRACIDECESILHSVNKGFPSILPIIMGEASSSQNLLEVVEANQTALFALECALAKMWMGWGIIPVAVVGHSLGEYAALVTSGVLSLRSALLIVALRVHLMVSKCSLGTTGMIAVNLVLDDIKNLLQQESLSELVIACYNSPKDYVLSGPLNQLKRLEAILNSSNIRNTILAVPFGYHSPVMESILLELTQAATSYKISPPIIPIVSNVLGQMILPGNTQTFTAEYFAQHCSQPVFFELGIIQLFAYIQQPVTFIEIGPHTSCLAMLSAHPAVALHKASLLASLRRQQQESPSSTLCASLASLYVTKAGNMIQWPKVFADIPDVSCINLPSYPFASSKFWVSFQETSSQALASPIKASSNYTVLASSFLHQWTQYPSSDNRFTAIFETPIAQLSSWISGHQVGGQSLCPASIYIELALAGITLGKRHLQNEHYDNHIILQKMEFLRPLVYDKEKEYTITTQITLMPGAGSFVITSYPTSNNSYKVMHVQGKFKYHSTLQTTTKFVQQLPRIQKQVNTIIQSQNNDLDSQIQVLSTQTIYQEIFSQIVNYTEQYHTIQSLTISNDGLEAIATIQVSSDHKKCIVNPIWIDTLLHVAGFLTNQNSYDDYVYICIHIGSLKVIPELIHNEKAYLIYSTNTWYDNKHIIVADSYALTTGDPKRIVAYMKGIQFQRIKSNMLYKSLEIADIDNVQAVHQPQPWLNSQNETILFSNQESLDIILQVIATVLQVDLSTLTSATSLDMLGLDSLAAIEILYKLKLNLGLDLPSNFFFQYPTVKSIQRYFSSISSSAQITSTILPQVQQQLSIAETQQIATKPVVIQQSDSDKPPLFLIHDGSGFANCYDLLSPLDHTIWAIHNPQVLSQTSWSSLIDMAKAYAVSILSTTPGPVLLGGWSFGGVVAYEIALQLTAQGIQVKGIILIDSPSPINHTPLTPPLINHILTLENPNIHNAKSAALIQKQFSSSSEMLSRYVPHATASLCPPLVLLRSVEGFSPSNGDKIQVPKWLEDRTDLQTSVAGWESLAHCTVKVLDIPGHHFSAFHPSNVEMLSLRIADACEYLEGL